MSGALKPLAEKLRPKNFDEIIGHDKIFSKTGSLKRIIKKKPLSSFILWGPAGCGKTTIAKTVSKQFCTEDFELSAVLSGVKDLRIIFEKARKNFSEGRQTILFIDEIHRFNKAQQDSFLPHIEKGVITLIGATTENPSFSIISPLLSRCQVIKLEKLCKKDLNLIKLKAEKFLGFDLPITKAACEILFEMVDGDARYFLNLIEEISSLGDGHKKLEPTDLKKLFNMKFAEYDKNNDQHFNLISALHKSLRASDTDASLYWLARMISSGEDPNYILRRLLRFSIEDIGLSEPNAVQLSIASWQAYERLGSPEGELSIAQLVIYLATCPKSNTSYKAWNEVLKFNNNNPYGVPPLSLLNAPTNLMKELDYGKGYIYDHEVENSFSGQNCFPENIKRVKFYTPIERGYEREIKKRLQWWDKLRSKNEK